MNPKDQEVEAKLEVPLDDTALEVEDKDPEQDRAEQREHVVRRYEASFKNGDTGGSMSTYRIICKIQHTVKASAATPANSFSQYPITTITHVAAVSSPCGYTRSS